ncbi:MAG: signal peptidase I [candidate division FCPU426 bacterium]
MTPQFWLAEHADAIFYGLFAALALAEIILRLVLKVSKTNKVLEYVDSGFIAILLAFVIRSFLMQTFIIPSGSMESTLLIKDQILVNKFTYGVRLPFTHRLLLPGKELHRGDIVVFRYPRNPKVKYVKRCIGLPGDRIEMRNKVLYVNDRPVDEPYVIHRDQNVQTWPFSRDNFGPVRVPEGQYFMLGDNRDESADSRYWGFLPKPFIEGRAWAVYWPLNRWQVIH